jgi:hypothetical protein
MEFQAGSPADAEAIAGLIASFQSELTDDPSGAGAEEYLASVSVQAERKYLASERYLYVLAYSDSQLAGFIAIRDGSHLFTSLSSAHIRARALPGACGSEHCGSCAFLAAMEGLPSTQAFPPWRCIKPSALFQQGQYRGCMASRFCPCGVRHQRRSLSSGVNQ